MVHNRYQNPGGEDTVYEAEAELLTANGHEVVREEENNDRIRDMNPAVTAAATVWNDNARRRLDRLVRKHGSQVVHFHNTFPLISPSAHYAARAAGAAVVQTLHNFRLICLNGLLFRSGKPCEECVSSRSVWPGIRHKCYRDSRAASGTVAIMLATHRAFGTWSRAVDVFIAPSTFSASLLVKGGLAEDRIAVVENFVTSEAVSDSQGAYFLFAGRLSEEKGILTLLDAWELLGTSIPLRIAGGGPLEDMVRSRAEKTPGVCFLGQVSRIEVSAQMRDAAAVVFPSLCYEVAPVSVIEALAAGRPALVSAHGAAASIIEHGITGYHFKPDDATDLAKQVEWVWQDRTRLDNLRPRCREEYARRFTAVRHYQRLMEIYEQAIAARAS